MDSKRDSDKINNFLFTPQYQQGWFIYENKHLFFNI